MRVFILGYGGFMANVCEKCGKRPQVGHTVSHSNIKTLRRFNPNIKTKRVFDLKTGKLVWRKLCTACLRTLAKTPRIRAKRKGAK